MQRVWGKRGVAEKRAQQNSSCSYTVNSGVKMWAQCRVGGTSKVRATQASAGAGHLVPLPV